jgi:predicted porin
VFRPLRLLRGTNVTIYGTFNASFERVEAQDTTRDGSFNSLVRASSTGAGSPELDPRNRVSDNSSNIGFRGTEDLGAGLKAIFSVNRPRGLTVSIQLGSAPAILTLA